MKTIMGPLILLALSTVPAFSKEDMSLRDLMESKETSVVTMLIGAAGLTLQWVNIHLEHEGKPRLYCPPKNLPISQADYVQMVKKYLEQHPRTGEETFQIYPDVLLLSLEKIYPC